MKLDLKEAFLKIGGYFLVILFIFLCYRSFSIGKSFADNNVQYLKVSSNSFKDNYKIKNISLNKVIVVGDSRMEFLNDRGDEIKIPTNFNFIALSGTKIDWLTNTALNVLEKKLNKMDSRYKYHIIFNMGVNDLEFSNDAASCASRYYEIYHSLAKKYNNINFYLLSVNPIDEEIIYKISKSSGRTNTKIIDFNNKTINLITNDNLNNIYYCDSYNSIDFGMPDGLHYDSDTDQKIVDYIVNKCVVYE